jgi:hypothetical protein
MRIATANSTFATGEASYSADSFVVSSASTFVLKIPHIANPQTITCLRIGKTSAALIALPVSHLTFTVIH